MAVGAITRMNLSPMPQIKGLPKCVSRVSNTETLRHRKRCCYRRKVGKGNRKSSVVLLQQQLSPRESNACLAEIGIVEGHRNRGWGCLDGWIDGSTSFSIVSTWSMQLQPVSKEAQMMQSARITVEQMKMGGGEACTAQGSKTVSASTLKIMAPHLLTFSPASFQVKIL